MARRTWWSTWPWARRSHGWRSSVAKAKRSEFCRRDEREEVVEVLRRRSLADPDRHAAPHLLGRLVATEALVVGADAGADVGVEVEACEERGVAVDREPTGDGVLDLGADAGVAEEEAGDVHHLGEAEDVLPPVEGGEVVGTERRSGRLEVRRRDARGEHDVDLDGEVGRGGEKRLEPLGAADVRDLVRVGDDGGRAVRGGVTREDGGRRHRRFDVDVGVPEGWREIRALQVDLVLGAGRAVRSEAEDAVARDADRLLVDLARQDVDDAGVPEDEVGGHRASGGVDERGQGELSSGHGSLRPVA